MVSIVAAMALTHAPGLTGWFTAAPKDQQVVVLDSMKERQRRLEAAHPDVIVAFSDDHLLNWPINNTPEYTVGIGDVHVGPADWYDEWLALKKYHVPGHPAARAVHRQLDMRIPFVPVGMICTVPPIPTPERAYQLGAVLREMLKAYPGPERIAVVETDSLSHEPGGPGTSESAKSSTAGSWICSRPATMRGCCARAPSSAWRRPARWVLPSCLDWLRHPARFTLAAWRTFVAFVRWTNLKTGRDPGPSRRCC